MFNPFIKKLIKTIYPIIPILSLRIKLLKICGYNIGKDVYLPASFKISDLKNRRNNVVIGDRVSIGPNVTIVTDSSPNNSKLIKIFPLVSKNVVIEEDAWLGANVVVLPGITIGKCSVIGSGSIVTKDVPPYKIAVGVPARVIKEINENEL